MKRAEPSRPELKFLVDKPIRDSIAHTGIQPRPKDFKPDETWGRSPYWDLILPLRLPSLHPFRISSDNPGWVVAPQGWRRQIESSVEKIVDASVIIVRNLENAIFEKDDRLPWLVDRDRNGKFSSMISPK